MPSNVAQNVAARRNWSTVLLGLGLLVVAASALWFARDIGRAGIAGNRDPGPHFFPVMLAILMIVFGLTQIGSGLIGRVAKPSVDSETDRDSLGTATGSFRWLILLAVLTVYVASIGWVGFSLSTLLLSAGLMVWLGNRWWVALIVSAVMVIVVKLLFVILFRVQLPIGELGLPF